MMLRESMPLTQNNPQVTRSLDSPTSAEASTCLSWSPRHSVLWASAGSPKGREGSLPHSPAPSHVTVP